MKFAIKLKFHFQPFKMLLRFCIKNLPFESHSLLTCVLQIFGSLFALGYPPIQILLVGAYIVSSYFGIVEKQFGRLEQVFLCKLYVNEAKNCNSHIN